MQSPDRGFINSEMLGCANGEFPKTPRISAYPMLSRLACFILLPLALLVAYATFALRDSLPASGRISLVTPEGATATVCRDGHGVAWITGSTDWAAFYALGYAQAQDRLWQLELQRRIASGRLSEVLGAEALSQDAWMRSLGLYESARSAWDGLGDDARNSLVAYSEGVNAWIAEKHVLPVEFLALGVKPEPWTPIDSLAWSKVFALNLAGNMWEEIDNLEASKYLSKTRMRDMGLTALARADGDLDLNPSTASAWQAMNQRLQGRLHLGGKYVGSNAWVVSGAHTQSGHPILANDPHLGLQMPSLWYMASLRGDRIAVSGMTIVGLPIVVFGRNQAIAWGGTSLMADVQDLEVLTSSPQHPNQYLQAGVWRDLRVKDVFIKQKAPFPSFLRPPMEPARLRLRWSDDGPVVSDVVSPDGDAMVLHWTGLTKKDPSYESLFKVNYATNWDDFVNAFRDFVAPAMTLVYADVHGNIGKLSIGRIPVRGHGEGMLPSRSWERDRWIGTIPYDEMPRAFNPPDGVLVAANDDPGGHDRYFISNDWARPYRAQRIKSLLKEIFDRVGRATVADMARIQGDTFDGGTARLRKLLSGTRGSTQDERDAIAYVTRWDGNMGHSSVGAAIYLAWTTHLRTQMAKHAAPELWGLDNDNRVMRALFGNVSGDALADMLSKDSDRWCDTPADHRNDPCADIIRSSLDAAIDELHPIAGTRMSEWTLGRIHHALYTHTPFSQIPSLARFFEGQVESGGSPDSINVANAVFHEAEGYRQTFGAGFRQIIEIGSSPVSGQWFMNSTGQSGNILSPHYHDMVIPFSRAQVYALGVAPSEGGK